MKSKLCSAAIVGGSLNYMHVWLCKTSLVLWKYLSYKQVFSSKIDQFKRHKPDHASKTFVTQCISITTAERICTHAFCQASSFLATISRNSEKQTSYVCLIHITELPPMRSGFSCRQVYVGFAVHKVTAGQLFSSSTSILPCLCHSTKRRIHVPFTCRWRHKILAKDIVLK